MNIGIFGDSFAEQHPSRRNDNIFHWADLLNDHHLTNYARGGSSLLFSYNNFIRYSENHDYNIFVVTSPGRLWIDNQELLDTGIFEDGFITGINSLDFRRLALKKKTDLNFSKRKLAENAFDSIENYFLIWMSDQQNFLIHDVVLKDIFKSKNTLFIPAFENSFKLNHKFTSLNQISLMELSSKKFKEVYPNEWKTIIKKKFMLVDYRMGHLSRENHKILYEKINEYIVSKTAGELQIDLDDFVVPSCSLESMIALTDGDDVFPFNS